MLKKENKFKTKNLHSWLGPLCIFLVAATLFIGHRFQVAKQQGDDATKGIGNSCHFVNGRCRFLIQGRQASAHFSEPPEPETSVTLTLTLPAGTQVESAWIEGVNMYMGKIPVLLDQEDHSHWSGWFMLGSCSEAFMKWQLRVNLKDTTEPTYLYFTTET